ncbi:1-aminocyclopropane-1-carboxylate deaminase/D-cysteine desulfhydrase [Neptunomonas japonica]|uniref:1-aminocyclopropane-1-carboxylate deaminase/D-cysteine desulfhydrase n=1 Tax=Neptunomonas japonica TaxID=417574 RepID=UPI000405521C|nr:pyridoxal-phosphate dependent enzyme [Neptunomonas japonica]
MAIIDLFDAHAPLVVEPLELPLFVEKKLKVLIVRADLVHPLISGNKWFKLKYNLLAACKQNVSRVISFGGPYSNHIHALAWSAQQLGIDSVGVIRGEEVSNPMLADAQKWGMQLHFVDRANYRERHDPIWQAQLKQDVGSGVIIPEGGSNALAVRGVAELMRGILAQLPDLDYLLCACGTGGTLAGLISAAPESVKLEGFPVLKGAGFLQDDVLKLLKVAGVDAHCPWSLDLDAHYGGYGKIRKDHKEHWLAMEEQFQILFDPVYTSKLLRRFLEKVEQGMYPAGATVALLHSGGVQGRRSIV